MDYSQRFLVKPGSKVKLSTIDPDFRAMYKSKRAASGLLKSNLEKIGKLQELLYAEHKRSLLVCLQALDAGGKDGTIKHVFGAMNQQGCRIASFKQPTSLEQDHDFLWRAHRDAPAKGEVTVFNRSHYEDVLVVRIHGLVTKPVWSRRYDEINRFEQHLAQNDTHILKFFLHISKEEQLCRFKDRLDDPAKHWKISAADYTERERFDDYMLAFEDMLTKCSTPHAPWFVIPSNYKWFRDLAISQILVNALEKMPMKLPSPSIDISQIRRQFHAEKKQR